MKQLFKFAHTMGAIGMMGALAGMLVLMATAPPPEAIEAYAQLRIAMGALAAYLLLPSLGLVLFTGLMSMSINRSYHNKGWAWFKLALGVVMFEGTLFSVQGPMRREAELAESVLAGTGDAAAMGLSIGPEWGSVWVILLVAVVNVVLGVWRPRFSRRAAD